MTPTKIHTITFIGRLFTKAILHCEFEVYKIDLGLRIDSSSEATMYWMWSSTSEAYVPIIGSSFFDFALEEHGGESCKVGRGCKQTYM